jgi:predicted dehydrogenase
MEGDLMKQVRWGILGTGGIAKAFVEDLALLPQAKLQAVSSRTQERADAFAREYDIPRKHTSCQGLAEDPEVDIIYIATPHSEHYAELLTCLNAGKSVLCEKAFTLNARQAEEAVALARSKKIFLMEGMWTRFLPTMRVVKDWVCSGRIGEITRIEASFCGRMDFKPEHRMFNMELGGGVLLDLGVYPIALTNLLLPGWPVEITGTAEFAPSGSDCTDELTLKYSNGAVANLSCGIFKSRLRTACIGGEYGEIYIPHEWYHPFRADLRMNGRRVEACRMRLKGRGYLYEALEAMRCLREGLTESPIMPLDDTLTIMRIMDTLRAPWGLKYPKE